MFFVFFLYYLNLKTDRNNTDRNNRRLYNRKI